MNNFKFILYCIYNYLFKLIAVSLSSTKNRISNFHWKCKNTWIKSAQNTLWCLLGCSIGDFGTILFFQIYLIPWSTISIMFLAIVNGIITSIVLETIVLSQQMQLLKAFRTAFGMSFLSMISMEVAMNLTDWILVGDARITMWVIPLMLLAGFLTPWPYNYYRIKKFNVHCH